MGDILLTVSNLLIFISYFLYIWAILKGKAKPHRTTRLVILIIVGTATASLLAQNSQTAIYLIGLSALFSIVIFILSFKYGMGGWSRLDMSCLVIALIGIAIWQMTNNPVFALYASIAADFTGVVPTLVKTYKYPKTEVWYFNSIAALGAFLNLITTRNWTIPEISYPLYLTFINLFIAYLILRKKINTLFGFNYKSN